ncbi:MAG: sugar phosphate nucleotidyltransferase [Wolbachia endosymbiont of Tyrophagus putrescentiae]|nr:sugar phosphate nucleotidyltransferase [Wolbachia endosymbiont of Tyrophagus putrescentiae]
MRPVILCGGDSSRLWPLPKPKQFQKVFNSSNTMLKDTLLRLKKDYKSPIITTNAQYKSLVMQDLHDLEDYRVILEPVKIGTAAAILIAALISDENEVMLVLPSDHFIGNLNNFHFSVDKACQIVRKTDAIVTFGVRYNEFNPEYGYINASYDCNNECHIVHNFLEKPAHELKDYNYWNSGIFVLRAGRYIDEIKKLAPDLYELYSASFVQEEKFYYLNKQDFEQVQNISIDHLVMEKTQNVAMIEADFDWVDVGTWNAMLELSRREELLAKIEFTSNLKPRVTSKVLHKSLISFINKIKDIKVIKTEAKPWGFFDIVLVGSNFLVKYLFINPLSCTSKQFHNYRDEYHIVLSGVGHVGLNDKVYAVEPNHVVEIPRYTSHRIQNKNANLPLEIIEFQVGEYLSDDDIVRLEDLYGRTA